MSGTSTTGSCVSDDLSRGQRHRCRSAYSERLLQFGEQSDELQVVTVQLRFFGADALHKRLSKLHSRGPELPLSGQEFRQQITQ